MQWRNIMYTQVTTRLFQGASKYLNEVTENRKVKELCDSVFEARGHTGYDCTDDKGTTQSKNLANIVAKCNKHSVKLDVSVHLNSGGGEGVEVLYVSSAGKEYAEKIAKEISKSGHPKQRSKENARICMF